MVAELAEIAKQRETGLLLCEHGGIRKEVYVSRGAPQFVTSNLAGELLGEYLVKHAVITRGELDMALAVMPRFEGRLGDTLVHLGLVDAMQLFQHIAEQVRTKLLDLFLWQGGTAAFYRDVAPPDSGFPLGLDPWAILLEGIKRRAERGLDDDMLVGRLDDELEAVHPAPIRLERLPEEAGDVMALLRAPQPLDEITRSLTGNEGVDGARAFTPLILLLYLGAVRFRTPLDPS